MGPRNSTVSEFLVDTGQLKNGMRISHVEIDNLKLTASGSGIDGPPELVVFGRTPDGSLDIIHHEPTSANGTSLDLAVDSEINALYVGLEIHLKNWRYCNKPEKGWFVETKVIGSVDKITYTTTDEPFIESEETVSGDEFPTEGPDDNLPNQ